MGADETEKKAPWHWLVGQHGCGGGSIIAGVASNLFPQPAHSARTRERYKAKTGAFSRGSMAGSVVVEGFPAPIRYSQWSKLSILRGKTGT
ncbi:hypothetical protein MXD81_20645, partial [Microbacteriaceae bacterium K1510]|nr:hypothetical protein [Microbacteriaceae bacterium K1510]